MEWRKVGSGFVSFVIEGEVAAVKSAVDAAISSASKVGEVTASVVIARPSTELNTTFNKAKAKK